MFGGEGCVVPDVGDQEGPDDSAARPTRLIHRSHQAELAEHLQAIEVFVELHDKAILEAGDHAVREGRPATSRRRVGTIGVPQRARVGALELELAAAP